MAIEFEALLIQNITVVYDSLDLASIDSGKLKTLRETAVQAAVMDVPEMIVAIYPPEPLLVQIGEKRIRMTLQGAHEIGSVPIWDYMFKCMRLVGPSKHQAIAYGFNYDVVVTTQGVSANDLLQQRFVGDVAGIEARLNGQIQTIAPRLKFLKNGVSYDLILEPVDEGRVKAHLNAHFEIPNHRLPFLEKFKSSFLEQYQYFEEIVSRLLS